MAVATDATLKILANNVNGIDTSGLMTDATGQDIVTAINTISSAISPSANNVTYNNTASKLTATNVQNAIDEIDSITDSLTATNSNISRYSGVSTSVPLPAISRRGKMVIIHFAHQLPAGTYLNIWNVTPAPASQQHAIVAIGNTWTIVAVTAAGVVKFNNSVTINSDQYIIGQIIYNAN